MAPSSQKSLWQANNRVNLGLEGESFATDLCGYIHNHLEESREIISEGSRLLYEILQDSCFAVNILIYI